MQKQDYIKIANARDPRLKRKKDRILYRFLEIMPGMLAWLTLVAIVLLSWLAPVGIAIFIIIFDLYWLFKTLFLSVHLRVAYKKVKQHIATDWLAKLQSLPEYDVNKNGDVSKIDDSPKLDWREIYHLIILPFAKEGPEVVRPTLQAIADSQYPHSKMIIVLAAEARIGQPARDIASQMQKEFGSKFFQFLTTLHPADIPCEIIGKGSNQTWAGKQAKKLIDELEIPYENIIISALDIDTRVLPHYFGCLAYHFVTTQDPWRSSYQPIPFYNNNIWQTPCFSRVVAVSGTFWQMMQQERPERLATFSSHSMPFKAVIEESYWNWNIVSEDSRIFWQSLLFYDGDYQTVPLYYPVSLDACYGGSWRRTIINQYKQQRRWGWGVENIPYVIFGFLNNKKISLSKKIRYAFNHFEGFWSWSTNALIIFLLGWLPLFLGGDKFNVTLLSYNLPRLTRWIMTLSMIGILGSAIYNIMILPAKPRDISRWRYGIMFLQWVLMPVTIMVFGCFPGLDAQTRLMLGKYMGFWNTDKPR
ncbi:MAG: hypothetical protein COY09_00320 [Candidatus Portnoybacteria bacterium CG_4_10_14_0_2_um_filter_39_11]|uniref:Glycosyltransferase 2-like domain-containing protein n=1 Tax=Candidatus Portnoybacteria bacterium CG_4_10_14_0_2_um_filter_39_11 TaxID=1974797 RepID=A0A2M7UKB5_9BACT|nr:MAG: hypothetical protein AUJ33_02115 [Parcubacteria group bacterium CG1_02_40_25]PIZ71656.1 MAG: hypothetical protein COY09_00320 [Candidatus Portnoybacteria bacterium CG_4_10_14_0_2_um_filter_39_11]